jgi:hypothetical protein
MRRYGAMKTEDVARARAEVKAIGHKLAVIADKVLGLDFGEY